MSAASNIVSGLVLLLSVVVLAGTIGPNLPAIVRALTNR